MINGHKKVNDALIDKQNIIVKMGNQAKRENEVSLKLFICKVIRNSGIDSLKVFAYDLVGVNALVKFYGMKVIWAKEDYRFLFSNITILPRVSLDSLSRFCDFVSRLHKSGYDIKDSLYEASKQVNDDLLLSVIQKVVFDISNGTELGKAVGKFVRILPREFIDAVNTMEHSGKFVYGFTSLARRYKRNISINSQIKKVMLYPVILLVLLLFMIIGMSIFLLPQLKGVIPAELMFENYSIKFLLVVGELFLETPIIGIFLIMSLGYGCFFVLSRLRFKIPLWGALLNDYRNYQIFTGLYMLACCGMPIPNALICLSRVFDNNNKDERWRRKNLLKIVSMLEGGKGLSDSFKGLGVFDDYIIKMMHIGEKSVNINSILENICDYLESNIKYKSDRIINIIQPGFVAFVGLVIIWVVVQIFLPMYESAISGVLIG